MRRVSRALRSQSDVRADTRGVAVVPIAPELLMTLAGGTASAAGQQIWTSLRDLVRRRTAGSRGEDAAPGGEDQWRALDAARDDARRARELAEVLALGARQDPAFAQALEDWRRQAEAAREGATGDVHNTVSGGTQTNVLQARDIHGSVNFGG
ncbi:hypothetical protein GCM10010524_24760 [Streptomyces mexicanus]